MHEVRLVKTLGIRSRAIFGGLEELENGLGPCHVDRLACGWRRWPLGVAALAALASRGGADPQNVANNTIVATIYKM